MPPTPAPVGDLPIETAGLVRAVLRSCLRPAAEIDSGAVLSAQPDYVVVRLALRRPARTVLLRLAGPAAPHHLDFARAAAVSTLVAERSEVPVPETLAAGPVPADPRWRYLLQSYLPGQEWMSIHRRLSAAHRDEVHRDTGRAVAVLHCLRFEAFGEIDPAGRVEPAGSYLDALSERAGHRIRDPAARAQILRLLTEQRPLFDGVGPPTLCHEDLHGHNVLVTQLGGRWRLAAILDFEKAWAGHREIDLARMEFWDGMTGPGFWAEYEQAHPTDDGYPARRPVYQFLWCLEFGAATARHLADTRRLARIVGVSGR